ncbi:spermatogenesis associated 2-like [Oryzias melastigma]|nr:spermatogenesis associated 2-like [Oryzias melastigma]
MHKQPPSSFGQAAEDLLRVYDHALEQQVLERGSSLPCREEKLWKQVEEMLKMGDARETHCLGLDPLQEMEEALQAGAAAGLRRRRANVRVGLKELAQVFEFLEQASLNLYLGPWRKEYKVIKMYSGRFTHYVAPVLSMPQIEKLFGLLGYEYGPSEPQQLLLQPPRVHPGSLNQFLRLSCAFFMARCECHLLWTALRNHPSDGQWELSLVHERRRGNALQVALENTLKKFEVKKRLHIDPDLEEDLYGADLEEMENGNFSLWPVQTPVQPETLRGSAPTKAPDKRSLEELNLPSDEKAGPESRRTCSCLNSPELVIRSLECDSLHDFSCAYFRKCQTRHSVGYVMKRPNGSTEGAAPDSPLGDDPEAPPPQPISFHACCDLTRLDPRVLCHSCSVFHSSSCRDAVVCKGQHAVSPLGVCSCGKESSRNPTVLCRYCGRDYCKDCWYRSPVACDCGQTLDQSTPV